MSEAHATSAPASPSRPWPDLRAVWRWHFYAGLFCIPFVLWLAITGSIYLFRPQIEAMMDRPYTQLDLTGAPTSASAQVFHAIAAVPGGTLAAYQLPAAPDSAVQILVDRGEERFRVYVHPETGAVLKLINDDQRFMRQIFHLHGELLMGDRGSLIVELAACWAIVMIVTGLILWWPRGARGLGGVLYPRLRKAFFWRDLHAVVGVWVSALALFLLVTGLPWTNNWGGYFKDIRAITGTLDGPQDWTTSRAGERATRQSEHAEHMRALGFPADLMQLDLMVRNVAALDLAAPVLISPPSQDGAPWRARSDAANRPLRADAAIDGVTGEVLSVRPFGARHPIDQAIGIGVAAHEGQLFGWLNQLLGLLAAIGLVTLAASGVVMWLKRRKSALFAAPDMMAKPRLSVGFALGFAAATIALPTLGVSALAVMAAERLILRRIPPVRRLFALT
ncbi:MAG: PepSY-associated TM helix domain-containing protein [Hyphomonadaceae bacterium]